MNDIMTDKATVETMFDSIASTYDKLNHILSFNIDKIWRKKAVKRIKEYNPVNVLDVACGTADSTIALAKMKIPAVVGVDISKEMLKIGKKKLTSLNLNDNVFLQIEDCERLGFEDNVYDGALIAFGVRNFEDIRKCLKELKRILKAGACLIILELSIPQNKIILALYKLYLFHILPVIGKKISGNAFAYHYLPRSIMNFPNPREFKTIFEKCGYKNVVHRSLSCGLCTMFEGFA